MRVVFPVFQNDNLPSGAVKQTYRHVDILNSLGILACVAYQNPDFRCTWFENTTNVMSWNDIEMTADDYLVLGETSPSVPPIAGADRSAKVVLCQNPFQSVLGFDKNLWLIRQIYKEAAAVLCSSKMAESKLRFMFPSSRVLRFQYSFDRPPWAYTDQKEKLVAVVPRDMEVLINAIIAVTSLKWVPGGWSLVRIKDMAEASVASNLRRCAVFLSLSDKTGFGMPPVEAMACGCVVVGFSGFGGSEYMDPSICFPVPDMDYIGLAETLINVMAKPVDALAKIGLQASDFVRREYSSERENDSVKEAWGKITRNVIEIRTEVRERMKKEVAVYMPVYNEGPYMESLLRWLVPRVGKIFVAESAVAWNPTGKPGGESKKIVDKVLADMPQARIEYLKVDTGSNGEPLKREAHQRNKVLRQIRVAGWKYVWMVEADEFYRNEEAENLWAWFFERESEGARAAKCLWQTYWRSVHWRVDPPEFFRPNVAFLSDCVFENGRMLDVQDELKAVEVPERLCVVRHYSWARTPSDIRRKLSAWGHAKETNPEWFDKVFMAWEPGKAMENLHPTVPDQYKRVVECSLPLPEAMVGHSFVGLDLIEDQGGVRRGKTTEIPMEQSRRGKIKAVIMHHNKPENADRLYEQLAPVFDDVEIFDNGSDPDKVPVHVSRSRENVYWTGTWNEVMSTCSDYDAVWVLGCDLELKDDPKEYRRALESSLPFGCWSPCIDGRAHPFMRAKHYREKQPRRVKNIEGMALAVSGELMRSVGSLVPGSEIGFGQDYWLCYRARKAGLKNVIDGRVVVRHPTGIGYDESKACRQMDNAFGKLYGPNFRNEIFEYDERYEYNLVKGEAVMPDGKKFTIVTVDNGWGLSEFMRVTARLTDARKIVMRKGVIEAMEIPGVETVPYDPSLAILVKEADVAFFPRVGVANKEDYLRILNAGIPVVVREACSQGVIQHEKNGYLFRDETWAIHWISFLMGNPDQIARIKRECAGKVETALAPAPAAPASDSGSLVPAAPAPAAPEPAPAPASSSASAPRVTVITPTYRRDPAVLRRCLGSMQLQTVQSWEQLVCSDGGEELPAKQLVEGRGDARLRYTFIPGKKQGDFGNTCRAEMLKQAKGDYVLFFDDDNVILPQYLEKMLAALDSSKADVAVCRIMHFGPLNEAEVGKPPKILTGDPVKLYHIDPLQVVVRREVMQKVGWDTDVGYLSDGVSLERLGAFKVVRVEEVLGVHM